jgi:hypothetical protein
MSTSLARLERDGIADAKTTIPLPKLVGETLPLTRNGRILVSLCPFHGERTPSFNVYEDHYHCFGCGAHGDAIDWLMLTRRMTFSEAVNYLSGSHAAHPTAPATPPVPVAPRSSPTAHLWRRCWDEGIDPSGTIVETYLASRGDLFLPDGGSIRFHPRCQRGPRDLPGGPVFAPAMLALMTDPLSGEAVGVHRTFLLPDGSGKAPVITRGDIILQPKTILGTWGTIRLAPEVEINRAVGIAEGIENALTAMQIITWGPTWAAGTAAEIAKFPVLPWIESLAIFTDGDAVGERAADVCAARWRDAGREVLICIPPPGKDWNEAFSARNARQGAV